MVPLTTNNPELVEVEALDQMKRMSTPPVAVQSEGSRKRTLEVSALAPSLSCPWGTPRPLLSTQGSSGWMRRT